MEFMPTAMQSPGPSPGYGGHEGGDGGTGGTGGMEGAGGGSWRRKPQSVQSWPYVQSVYVDPGPPSSQMPSSGYRQVFWQIPGWAGGLEGGHGEGGGKGGEGGTAGDAGG
eukprot:3990573-Prymnesium_polylepis.2